MLLEPVESRLDGIDANGHVEQLGAWQSVLQPVEVLERWRDELRREHKAVVEHPLGQRPVAALKRVGDALGEPWRRGRLGMAAAVGAVYLLLQQRVRSNPEQRFAIIERWQARNPTRLAMRLPTAPQLGNQLALAVLQRKLEKQGDSGVAAPV